MNNNELEEARDALASKGADGGGLPRFEADTGIFPRKNRLRNI